MSKDELQNVFRNSISFKHSKEIKEENRDVDEIIRDLRVLMN